MAPSVLGPIMSYLRASTLTYAYIHTLAHTHTYKTHSFANERIRKTPPGWRGRLGNPLDSSPLSQRPGL